MELNFDKEINALLRQAAKDSGQWSAVGRQDDGNPQSHLDADEISAFAENALPEKTRAVYIKHFADCDRCRTILSNTILLNQEAETESASSAVAAPVAEIVETKIPWYRKMFLMPNLAYMMGALVLVFGGMLGFIALQSLYQTSSSDVSRIQENAPARSSGPNSSDETVSYNSNATANNSNAAASNAATMTANSNSAMSASNAAASNTQTFPPNAPLAQPSVSAEPQKQNAAKPTDDLMSAKKNESKDAKENEFSDKNSDLARSDEAAKAMTGAPPPATARAAPPLPSVTMRRTENLPQVAPNDKKKDRAISGATNNSRQIGGKTFNRVGGVWIDSTYNAYDGGTSNAMLPPTRTIRRGSNEYQKLDKQVRIIAESLDGAVIIVWRDGAYRIQ